MKPCIARLHGIHAKDEKTLTLQRPGLPKLGRWVRFPLPAPIGCFRRCDEMRKHFIHSAFFLWEKSGRNGILVPFLPESHGNFQARHLLLGKRADKFCRQMRVGKAGKSRVCAICLQNMQTNADKFCRQKRKKPRQHWLRGVYH